jgi:hypothetical protein
METVSSFKDHRSSGTKGGRTRFWRIVRYGKVNDDGTYTVLRIEPMPNHLFPYPMVKFVRRGMDEKSDNLQSGSKVAFTCTSSWCRSPSTHSYSKFDINEPRYKQGSMALLVIRNGCNKLLSSCSSLSSRYPREFGK